MSLIQNTWREQGNRIMRLGTQMVFSELTNHWCFNAKLSVTAFDRHIFNEKMIGKNDRYFKFICPFLHFQPLFFLPPHFSSLNYSDILLCCPLC